jgi:NAD(P)-dependent dehydrogenase (short-subunit alcohol dehydrogenase family)
VARAVAAHGATVVLAVRDLVKGTATVAEIASEVRQARLEVCQCDIASLDSVRAAGAEILARHHGIDVLINNAGIMAVPLSRSPDGFERQLATNHIGHFLLTTLLLPALVAAAPSRVVSVSSRGHRLADIVWNDPHYLARSYDRWEAYGQSKTANILFVVELNRRYRADGVTAVAVHPGMVKTNMAAHLHRSDLREMASRLPGGPSTLKTIPQGAASICWAAFVADLAMGDVYVENCHVSGPVAEPNAIEGQARWASSPARAQALWGLSERWVDHPHRSRSARPPGFGDEEILGSTQE